MMSSSDYSRRLAGRTALITGASRGIGRAIAERFSLEGAKVAINFTRNRKAASEVASRLLASGGEARIYQADIGLEQDCQKLAEDVTRDFGQVDILVNNAGLGSAAINRPKICEATNEQWNSLLSVNLWGPIWLCRALIPTLRAAERSDVIMISSTSSQKHFRRSGVYSVSKAALEAMAHTLANEEKSNGMRVNIISPGLVATDMGKRIVEVTTGDSDLTKIGEKSPFGFVCHPDDIAAAAAFLCSNDGRYVTGQRLTISGEDN